MEMLKQNTNMNRTRYKSVKKEKTSRIDAFYKIKLCQHLFFTNPVHQSLLYRKKSHAASIICSNVDLIVSRHQVCNWRNG